MLSLNIILVSFILIFIGLYKKDYASSIVLIIYIELLILTSYVLVNVFKLLFHHNNEILIKLMNSYNI